MKHLPLILILILILILMVSINQVIYTQSIVDEISQAFENLTSGLLGNKAITDPLMTADIPPVNINNAMSSQVNRSKISSESVPY